MDFGGSYHMRLKKEYFETLEQVEGSMYGSVCLRKFDNREFLLHDV
ncbi:hypothetical protein A2U01_0110148, partial [Trifolium medium]|nr:hypothetical protein [Trifolium medium]